jgi:hypothetical protein
VDVWDRQSRLWTIVLAHGRLFSLIRWHLPFLIELLSITATSRLMRCPSDSCFTLVVFYLSLSYMFLRPGPQTWVDRAHTPDTRRCSIASDFQVSHFQFD